MKYKLEKDGKGAEVHSEIEMDGTKSYESARHGCLMFMVFGSHGCSFSW